MKKYLVFVTILIVGIYQYFRVKEERSEWDETIATISKIEEMEKGKYGYSIIYNAPNSTAVNNKNQSIKGPITQYVFSEDKPINNQKLKIRYRIDEPIIFEFIEKLKIEKK